MGTAHTSYMNSSLTPAQELNSACQQACKDLPPSEKWGTHHSSSTTHLPDPHHTKPHATCIQNINPQYTYFTNQVAISAKTLMYSILSFLFICSLLT